jgi:hypothetical protein
VERFAGDMSQLEYDEDGNLLYNGNAYYRADDRFEVITKDNDKVVELGWQSQFPFFPDMHYYAFDEDNPLFIFCENGESTLYTKGVYVRSDYDLYTQVYTVENSNIEIPLVSAMTQSDVEATAIDHETLKMFLKDRDNYMKTIRPKSALRENYPQKHNTPNEIFVSKRKHPFYDR